MKEDLQPPAFAADSSTLAATAYAQHIATRLEAAHHDVATLWLERLIALLPVEPNSVFSSHLLLDHIPGVIDELAKYVAAPADEDISARAVVIDKARELGQLRHQQQASLHQVLREYDLLAEILEQFIIDETRSFPAGVSTIEVLEVSRRIHRAVRVLMQITANTFIAQYIETITDQATRLDRFNRAVSHELRNILGTLQFGAEILEDPEACRDDDRRSFVAGTIHRNTDRALKIIRSFERMPRSGILNDSPSEQVVEVGEIVEEVFRQVREMADARGVSLTTSTAFPKLYLDTGALELILINLVSNAVKYSDPGKPERFVSVEGEHFDGHYRIRVADNGLGIPDEAATRVFERFARAHAHLDDRLGVDGTGLGLSIVEECVKALNGEIRLDTAEGKGTTFTISIPKKVPPIST